MMEFDKILQATGPFGWFQAKVIAICYFSSLLSCLCVFLDSFVNFSMDYRCLVPACDQLTSSDPYIDYFLNFTTPWDSQQNTWDNCNYYKTIENQTHTSDSYVHGQGTITSDHYLGGGDETQCSEEEFSGKETMTCDSGYVFDTEVFTSSTVIEFNLTCESTWKLAILNSSYMVGMLFGAILIGFISDIYGRKMGLVNCVVLVTIGGVIAAFSHQFWLLVLGRLICGIGGNSLFGTAFIIVVEFVVPEHRAAVGILVDVPFAIGGAVVALFGYLIRDSWRWLTLACVLPSLLLLPVLWFLPESIRWLKATGRHVEAGKVLLNIEKLNGKLVPRHLLDSQTNLTEIACKADVLSNGKIKLTEDHGPGKISRTDETLETSSEITGPNNFLGESELTTVDAKPTTDMEKMTLFDLLRLPNMRKRCLVNFFIWASVTLVFYGLTENSTNMAGNIFINFVLSVLIEIPSYFFAWFAVDRMGRKGTLLFVLTISGVSCITAALLPRDSTDLIILFSLLGKFGAAAAFSIVYLYSSELFPTAVRGVSIGACSMCARIGGILAPIVTSLGQLFYPPLPALVFGTLGLFSAALTLLLPETRGCILPTTLEESEQFGCDQPLFYFQCDCGIKSRRGSESSLSDSEKRTSDGTATALPQLDTGSNRVQV